MENSKTVWDLINDYLPQYNKLFFDDDPAKLRRERTIATFSYWAFSLGLKPPQKLVESLTKAGLSFEPPSKFVS